MVDQKRLELVEHLKEIAKLLEWLQESPYRIKAYKEAALRLRQRTDIAERIASGRFSDIPSIGPSIEETIRQFLERGTSDALSMIQNRMIPGTRELMKVPGMKLNQAEILIRQLRLTNLEELEAAIEKEQLSHIKGLGPQFQKRIRQGLKDLNAKSEKRPLQVLLHDVLGILLRLQAEFPGVRMEWTGAFRRRVEILSSLQLLVADERRLIPVELIQSIEERIQISEPCLPVQVIATEHSRWGQALIETTGTAAHVDALKAKGLLYLKPYSEEATIYEALGLPFIPPILRETGEETTWSTSEQYPLWIGHVQEPIRGVFHVHTHASDGMDSLEDMISKAQSLAFEYIGISDHSQSAVYAKGLQPVRLLEQKKHIDSLRLRYPRIHIFFGVESDIREDGSLDYDDEVLRACDFVIASIHRRFSGSPSLMTQRIEKALRHPATTFLGHPTGRLVLGRAPLKADFPYLFQVAKEVGVAIEMNAAPKRLDLSWEWGSELRAAETMVSIHPDAHAVEGLEDVHWGVLQAEKALLPQHQVLNTRNLSDVTAWIRTKAERQGWTRRDQ
jgi:DNA polymerase (family X)